VFAVRPKSASADSAAKAPSISKLKTFLVADRSQQKKIFDIAKRVTQYPRAAIMLLT
jgi:hypothetical protein